MMRIVTANMIGLNKKELTMALLASNKTRSEQGSVNKALSEQGPCIYDTVKHMTSVSRFEICQHVWNICTTWGTFMYQQSIDVEDLFF